MGGGIHRRRRFIFSRGKLFGTIPPLVFIRNGTDSDRKTHTLLWVLRYSQNLILSCTRLRSCAAPVMEQFYVTLVLRVIICWRGREEAKNDENEVTWWIYDEMPFLFIVVGCAKWDFSWPYNCHLLQMWNGLLWCEEKITDRGPGRTLYLQQKTWGSST